MNPPTVTYPASVFYLQLKAVGIGEPEREFRFAPPRRWRFDYCWPEQKVALEVEGGIWTRGRHTRGKGFLADVEKYNAATLNGWRVFRVIPSKLNDDATIEMLREALKP